jgi:hypothetical protein
MDKVIKAAFDGTVLANDGKQFSKGIWEFGVYLGTDGFVYFIEATTKQNEMRYRVMRKNTVGEYLRWVDDIHSGGSGQLPAEDNNIHYQAAWALREII